MTIQCSISISFKYYIFSFKNHINKHHIINQRCWQKRTQTQINQNSHKQSPTQNKHNTNRTKINPNQTNQPTLPPTCKACRSGWTILEGEERQSQTGRKAPPLCTRSPTPQNKSTPPIYVDWFVCVCERERERENELNIS